MIQIFNKNYASEELADVTEDIMDCFNNDIIPIDEHGFHNGGYFNIKVEWIED